ncbi:hypothetical protein ARMSODRAFT_80060 [Armillaria solidipes]|uniref:Uncharacterized protein n=1 Tax=Armillaria solidipes TaxID=1076256 RepID=A0A2H3AJE5_9AGAR|nr:hypothetical protein ARMSODRAFT_80060 [Armillaria solidipes]
MCSSAISEITNLHGGAEGDGRENSHGVTNRSSGHVVSHLGIKEYKSVLIKIRIAATLIPFRRRSYGPTKGYTSLQCGRIVPPSSFQVARRIQLRYCRRRLP